MYYIGIDIAKFKHAVFIQDDNGEIINKGEYFENTIDGFQKLLTILNNLEPTQQKKIGLEATGHYHMNLIAFLQNHGYDVCELNPYFVKKYRNSITLRKNKNDFIDAEIISSYLIKNEVKSYPQKFYHIYSLKSLCRKREELIKDRSKTLIALTNSLDIIFPEFKPFFKNKFTGTALYILKNYETPNHIARMNIDSFNKMKSELRRTIPYSEFITLKDLAHNTVGFHDSIQISILKTNLESYFYLDKQVSEIEELITNEIQILKPKMLGIKWFSVFFIATIYSEYNGFDGFDSASKCLAFAGLEGGRYQSGQVDYNLPMVKHGSGYLRNALIYGSFNLLGRYPVLYEYYHKKRNEGKSHYVALSHVAKKLLRVIFYLEKNNIDFDPNLLK